MKTLLNRFMGWLCHNPDLEPSISLKTEPFIKEETTDIDKAIHVFLKLSKSFDVNVFSPDYRDREISVPVTKIDAYIDQLNLIIECMRSKADIGQSLPILQKSEKQTIMSFFETTEGFYATYDDEALRYSALNARFLRQFQIIQDPQKTKSFTDQRNLRLVRNLVDSIILQSKELEPWIFEKLKEDSQRTSSQETQAVS